MEISKLIGLSQDKATEKVEKEEELVKQYQSDMTPEEANAYYEGCIPLPFNKLTENTPEGEYVNY